MAIPLACNWGLGLMDAYTRMGWQGNPTLVTTLAKRHVTPVGVGSAYAAEYNNSSGYCPSPVIAGTPRFLHFYYIAGATGSPASNIVYFFKLGGPTAMMRIDTTGLITLSRGTATAYTSNTIVATAAANINAGVGHWIAIELDALDAAGTFTVWVDGVQAVTFSGDTKGHATSAGWDQFGFKELTSSDDWYISDVIVTDNTTGRLAETWTFGTLVPTSVTSGNLTGVASTGSNRFQNIDEVPVSTTDYNEAAAANDEDLYGFSNLAATAASIAFVQVIAEAARAGSITGAQIRVKSGATDSYDSTKTLPATSFEPWARYLTTDPNTAAAWTGANVDACEFGLKFVS